MNELIDDAITMRRRLHQVPEVGFTEYITTHLIYNELSETKFHLLVGTEAVDAKKQMGHPSESIFKKSYERAQNYGVPKEFLQHMRNGQTGLVATLDTGRPGNHIALRFDIDGLPITEHNSEDHTPVREGFMSKHEGEMHACGHDAHASIGIAVAKYISQHIDYLTGKFTIIFQAAEEGVRGANSYVSRGFLNDADYFFSGHVGTSSLPVGTVVANTMNFLASTKFNVEVFGKSAHAGADPQDGYNALLAASNIALSLNTIPRHRDGVTRVNVGELKAEGGRNVISDYAQLVCECRGETSPLNDYMFERAKAIIHHAAKMYYCEATVSVEGQAPSAQCDQSLIPVIKEANANNSYIQEIVDDIDAGASEDATVMINAVQEHNGKATYMTFPFMLKYGHHHPQFDVDENVIPVAISTYIHIIDYLNKK